MRQFCAAGMEEFIFKQSLPLTIELRTSGVFQISGVPIITKRLVVEFLASLPSLAISTILARTFRVAKTDIDGPQRSRNIFLSLVGIR